MSLTKARRPSLKDKLDAEELALQQEEQAVEVELEVVKKAKKRASKS